MVGSRLSELVDTIYATNSVTHILSGVLSVELLDPIS